MVVGRFRDGTPLALKDVDGAIPAKSNDFRYDGLDFELQPTSSAPRDRLGLKCPFQAHIRKTNPRQSVNAKGATELQIKEAEHADRDRRIVRRGIPYGTRNKHPDRFQALDDLPSKDVGLLFGCFQSSITRQFSFMQKTWANNLQFKIPLRADAQLLATGLDPLIGQGLGAEAAPEQNWRKEYGGDAGQNPGDLQKLSLELSHPTSVEFGGFIKFRGGEFFFAPSLLFLNAGATNGARTSQDTHSTER
jgi:deferrochelatase/peroxidase EfeB